jgi:hypothetical protein
VALSCHAEVRGFFIQGCSFRLEATKKPTDECKHTTSNREVVYEYACGFLTVAEKGFAEESIQQLAGQGVPITNTGCYEFVFHVSTPPY